jgi:hypothetical protein
VRSRARALDSLHLHRCVSQKAVWRSAYDPNGVWCIFWNYSFLLHVIARSQRMDKTPDSNAAAVKKYGARMRRRLKAKAIRAVLYVPSKIGIFHHRDYSRCTGSGQYVCPDGSSRFKNDLASIPHMAARRSSLYACCS